MLKKLFTGLLLPALLLSSLSVPVYAAVKSDDSIYIAADETLDDDLFAAGSEVIIDGVVNGDVYAVANQIIVRGTVNGDVIAGGSSIDISGTVTEDVRVGGSSIRLAGATVGDSLTAAGNRLTIDSSTTIGGGLLFGGSSLSLDGSVGRGITAAGQSTRIDGPVGRTVRIAAEEVTIGSEAVINGDLEYNSETEASISGSITGDVRFTESDVNFDAQSFLQALTIGFTLWAFVGAAIIAAAMILLFPTIWKKADQKFAARPWATAAYGSVALLLTIPVLVFLAITIVGIPFALIILLLWFVAIYMAKIFAAYAAGSRLLMLLDKKPVASSKRAYVAILIGLVLYYLLRIVPGIGMLIRFATTIVGLGMILSLYQRSQPAKSKAKKKEA